LPPLPPLRPPPLLEDALATLLPLLAGEALVPEKKEGKQKGDMAMEKKEKRRKKERKREGKWGRKREEKKGKRGKRKKRKRGEKEKRRERQVHAQVHARLCTNHRWSRFGASYLRRAEEERNVVDEE
jgi:hypothetical protein